LSYGSKYNVEFKCDYCGDNFHRAFRRLSEIRDFHKDSCRKCLRLRNIDILLSSLNCPDREDIMSTVDLNCTKISSVYCIRHVPTNKSYIGSSNDTISRFKGHIIELEKGSHYVKEFNESNLNDLEFLILERTSSNLLKKEYKYIQLFNTYDRRFGFNVYSNFEEKANSSHTNYSYMVENISKLNVDDAKSIKRMILNGCKMSDISDYFNVSYESVYDIKMCKTWVNVLPELNDDLIRFKRSDLHKGQNNSCSKLTEEKVKEIKLLLNKKELTMADISRKYGVSRTLIGHIKRGKLWSHVS